MSGYGNNAIPQSFYDAMAQKVYGRPWNELTASAQNNIAGSVAQQYKLSLGGGLGNLNPNVNNTDEFGNFSLTDPYAAATAGNNPYSGLDPGTLGQMFSSYASMYGANAAANSALGQAYFAAVGNVQAAQAMADAQKVGADYAHQSSNYGNDAQVKIAGIGADATKNVKTQDVNQNLAPNGLYATQKDIAGINAGAMYGAAVDPVAMKMQALMALLGGGSISGSGAGGQIAGLGGAFGGALGALGVPTGGGTGGGSGGSIYGTGTGPAPSSGTFSNPYQAPPAPTFQNFDNVLALRRMGADAAKLSRGKDSAVYDFNNSLANRGFSTKSPGAQFANQRMNMLNQQGIVSDQNDVLNAQQQYNNQGQGNMYSLAANQYNTQQDQANRLAMAKLVGNQNLTQSLTSGLLA